MHFYSATLWTLFYVGTLAFGLLCSSWPSLTSDVYEKFQGHLRIEKLVRNDLTHSRNSPLHTAPKAKNFERNLVKVDTNLKLGVLNGLNTHKDRSKNAAPYKTMPSKAKYMHIQFSKYFFLLNFAYLNVHFWSFIDPPLAKDFHRENSRIKRLRNKTLIELYEVILIWLRISAASALYTFSQVCRIHADV